ncbi:hypothetical protein ABZU92_18195 [Micromonospora arida]|uniref:hypothetical protein n=1 Tax=Micromonospora arida TaxID=2203715 RepID=UPI0033BB7777
MHTPTAYRYIRAAARTLCAALLSIRVADIFGVIDLAEYVWLGMLPFFIAGIGVAAWSSYRIRAHRAEVAAEAAEQRAQVAELEAARLRRQETLLDGDEDQALWDSVPAAGSQDDTCAFGTQVVVLDQRRHTWGQQAG